MIRLLACLLAAAVTAIAASVVLGGDSAADRKVIAGVVVDEYDHPLANWNVALLPIPEWMPSAPHGVTGADGRFRLTVNPRIAYRVQVAPSGTWPGPPITDPVRAGTTDLKLVVKPDLMRHARIRCRVVSPEGANLPSASVFVWGRGGGAATFELDAATGESVSGRVEPGIYSVCANDPACGWYQFGPVEVKDAADVDAGTLTFPRLGVARIVPVLPDVPERGKVLYHVLGIFPEMQRRWYGGASTYGMGKSGEFADGSAVDCPVTPGKYLVRVDGIGVQTIERTIEVRSGETTTVPLTVSAPPMRAVRLRFPGVLPAMYRLQILEPSGDATWTSVMDEGAVAHVRLAPAKYRLDVETDDLRRFTADLVVPDDPTERLDVKLTPAPADPARPR